MGHTGHHTTRAGRGSLAGRWLARADGAPNFKGGLTIEQALPAGAKLWLAGWTKQAGADGPEFISLAVDVSHGGPPRATDVARQEAIEAHESRE
jgi:hypothetical protein